MTLQELEGLFKKHLNIEKNTVRFLLALFVSNFKIRSDPVWALYIASSGRTKTELAHAFSDIPGTIEISSLSPSTFISGMVSKNGKGCGIFQRMGSGNYFVLIKDFTTILSIRSDTQREIVSQLREIWDGKYSKHFGNELGKQVWTGKVGLLGFTTLGLDTFEQHSLYQAFGERFIYWHARPGSVGEEKEMAKKSLRNIGKEKVIRSDLKNAVSEFFNSIEVPKTVRLSQSLIDRISALATFVASARSPVLRHYYSREIEIVPDVEAPNRIAKQLSLLATALSIFTGEKTDENYGIVLKAGFNAVPRNRLIVIRYLTDKNSASTAEIAGQIGVGSRVAFRILEELEIRQVLSSDRNKGIWYLSDIARELMRDGIIQF